MTKALQNMFKRMGMIIGLFLLAVLIISAAQKKQQSTPVETIVHIKPLESGHSLVTAKDIRLTIERTFGQTLEEQPIAVLDVELVEKVLRKDPFLKDVDVYLDAERQLHIDIEQREPLLRVRDKHNQQYYLDDFGNRLPLSDHFTARVLVATGAIPSFIEEYKTENRHALKHVFELAQIINKDPFYAPMIEQIHVKRNNELVIIPKLGKQKILLGKPGEYVQKLKKLKIFYHEGIPYAGWDRYKEINLEYNGQVVCR